MQSPAAGQRFAARDQLGAGGDARRRPGRAVPSPSRLSQATTPASASSTPSAGEQRRCRGRRPTSSRRRPGGGARAATPPQSSGIGAANPAAGFAPAGTGWRRQPGRDRADLLRASSCFAIRAMQSGAWAPALAVAPGAELGIEVVARQAEQAGHDGATPVSAAPWQLHAGRHAARRIALVTRRAAAARSSAARATAAAAGTAGRGRRSGRRSRAGRRRRAAPAGRHQRVVAPAVAEVEQLVEQVAGRLAGDARVVAVGRRAALRARGSRCRRARAAPSCPRTAARRARRGGAEKAASAARRKAARRTWRIGGQRWSSITPGSPASRTACASAAASLSGPIAPDRSATPSRSARGRFWLIFHLPTSEVSGSRRRRSPSASSRRNRPAHR